MENSCFRLTRDRQSVTPQLREEGAKSKPPPALYAPVAFFLPALEACFAAEPLRFFPSAMRSAIVVFSRILAAASRTSRRTW